LRSARGQQGGTVTNKGIPFIKANVKLAGKNYEGTDTVTRGKKKKEAGDAIP